jgi:hypothetical protein
MGYYSTEDEMQYLRSIGEHKKNGRCSVESLYSRLMPRQQVTHKVKLLKNYIAMADKREDWGSIERRIALGCARQELERLTGSGGKGA